MDRDRGPAKDGGSLATNSTFLTKKTYVLQQGRFWETDFYLFGDFFQSFEVECCYWNSTPLPQVGRQVDTVKEKARPSLMHQCHFLFGVTPLRFLAVAGRINCQKSPLRVQVTTRDCAAELKMAAIWSVFLLSHCFMRHYVMILLYI